MMKKWWNGAISLNEWIEGIVYKMSEIDDVYESWWFCIGIEIEM